MIQANTIGNFVHALNQLSIYKEVVRDGGKIELESSIDRDSLQKLKDILKSGWTSEFDSDEEKHLLKMLVAASTEAIMSDKSIPDGEKVQKARENASVIQQVVDTIKLDFYAKVLPVEEMVKHRATTCLSLCAAGLDFVKKEIEKEGIKKTTATAIELAATTVGAFLGNPEAGKKVGRIAKTVISLIPDEWAKKVEDKAIDLLKNASNTVEAVSEKVKNFSIVKLIEKPVKKILKSKFVTTIKQAVEKQVPKVIDWTRQVLFS